MNPFKNAITAILISFMVVASCQRSRTTQELVVEPSTDTTTSKTIIGAIVMEPEEMLSDTLGLYKLTNKDARVYVVKMFVILSDMDKAIDDKSFSGMAALLSKQNALQRTQLKIQSSLSETDRMTFKVYANRISDKLLALADRIEEM